MEHAELRATVCQVNRDLARSALVVLTFGNASAADQEAGVMGIKPSGASYDELTPEDVVLVSLTTGEPLGSGARPSTDTPSHLELYRRFGALGGIVHTHSPYATAWAQARRALPCLGTTHADHFRGTVPVTGPLTPDEISGDYEAATGRAIVACLVEAHLDPREMPAALVAGHGPFAWGATAEEALENAIALEHVALIAAHQAALGELEPLPDALRDRHFTRKHGPAAYYGQPVPATGGGS